MHPIPNPSRPAAPIEAARGLAHWERLTRAALEAHRHGRLEIALAAHVRALWTAEALVDGGLLAMRPDDCLAALVVSHHNLSELYRCRGQLPQAADHLCLPHRLLLRLLEEGGQPHDVRQAAWRHLRETRAQLLGWLRAYGEERAVEAALHATPAPAFGQRPAHLH
ncbi:Uncharacterised protein [Xylophilus ampelinus]|nr:hypothetical protein [Variovorax sp.]VTY39023.1 Uncharacterised protein [Xylophilus ampelinus]